MLQPAIQPSSRPVSARTVMIDLNAVRAARGVDADQVNKLIEEGKLVWVWDVSTTHKRRPGRNHPRALRFWAAEIWPTEDVSQLGLEAVIDRIVPKSRQTFRGTEIANMLLVSRPKVRHLRSEVGGKIERRTLFVPRESLAAYLRRRWIGGGN